MPLRRLWRACGGHAARAALRRLSTVVPPLLERVQFHGGRVAVRAARDVTYESLDASSKTLASRLLSDAGRSSLNGDSVALCCPPGAEFVTAVLAVWRAGGTAVPLSPAPPAALQYVIDDARVGLVLHHKGFILDGGGCDALRVSRVVDVTNALDDTDGSDVELPDVSMASSATVMYTSGTTGRPKGVVMTHDAITAQVTDLVTSWLWSPSDHILHFLPLHHVHGVVNKLLCALWSGAVVEFIPFTADGVWRRMSRTPHDVTLFMAVPTIYRLMIDAFDRMTSPDERAAAAAGAGAARLMVSGSAPLPVPVLERWRAITGHTLLERYGMTELGMVLSNPAKDVSKRRPGCVGLPLPSARVKIVSDGRVVTPPDESAGELYVKGRIVFREYRGRPDATAEAFDAEGYFKTGDIAAWSVSDGSYRVLGRASVDIIKTAGHKVSALEVETVLSGAAGVADVAVLGVPHDVWGEVVAALVVPSAAARATFDVSVLHDVCEAQLPREKRPRLVRVVDAIPKNAMGKVAKRSLVPLFAHDAAVLR